MYTNYDNVFKKEVFVEKLNKLSYFVKKEQEKYKTIDVNLEILSLLSFGGDIPGYYCDFDFLKNNS